MPWLLARCKMVDIARNLVEVQRKVAAMAASLQVQRDVRLVAVSKTKPAEAVLQAYEAGQRAFGENYVNELVEKASNPQILELCPDIKWHFIGHLQRNKVKKLLSAPNLAVVESVDSPALASELEKQCAKLNPERLLRVFLQLNSSGEESKSGCANEEDLVSLARHTLQECPHLRLAGLMTIGAYGVTADPGGDNADFSRLAAARRRLCDVADLGLSESEVELSMGMSGDFELAIRLGSTNVRVGSTIFGAREPKK